MPASKDESVQKSEEATDEDEEFVVPRSMYALTAFCSLALLILFAGAVAMPSLFWDKLIWPYLWGPVAADAAGASIEGVREGYNILNTVVYALLFALVLYWSYALIKKLRIVADWRFILALSPFVALGGSLRALEDAGLFTRPAVYFFIAPQIYLTIAMFVVLGLFFTWLFVKRMPLGFLTGDKGLLFLLGDLAVVSLCTLWFVGSLSTSSSFHPIYILIIAAVSFLVSRLKPFRDEKYGTGYLAVAATNGTFLFLMSGAFILGWLADPWTESVTTRPWEILVIPAIALSVTLVSALVFWRLSVLEKLKGMKLFLLPSSLLIWAGHMLDASATYRGISAFGYTEKHVLSRTLINITGTPLVMFLEKALVIGAVIYILEAHVKPELKDRTLMGLLRLAIFVLGFAPGLRDLLRIAMGV